MPAAEKYSRILQPPLSVLAGHDCDGKPEEKELRTGLLCQKVRYHTLALDKAHWVWTMGRFGHNLTQHDTTQRGLRNLGVFVGGCVCVTK